MSLEPLNNLQSKVDALDDLLECPVCYERLSGDIPQCTQGHHVCGKCLIRIDQCPLCSCKFNGTRNYLAESVLTKFEEIKSALVDVSRVNGGKCCATAKIPEPQPAMLANVEKFPCGIDKCSVILPYNHMIAHIKSAHEDILVDVGVVKSYRYTDFWPIDHDYSSLWEKIIYIKNMGIFFPKVYISNKGNVYGYVQNINKSHGKENFYWELEMGDEYEGAYFSGPVESTSVLHIKGKYSCIEDLVYEDYYGNDCFDCSVLIH